MQRVKAAKTRKLETLIFLNIRVKAVEALDIWFKMPLLVHHDPPLSLRSVSSLKQSNTVSLWTLKGLLHSGLLARGDMLNSSWHNISTLRYLSIEKVDKCHLQGEITKRRFCSRSLVASSPSTPHPFTV